MDNFLNSNDGQGTGAAGTPYAEYLPAINVPEGLNRLMNNKKLYFTMLKSFISGTMSQDLLEVMPGEDKQKTASTAHALKGVAANLGLSELWRISAEIEACAKQEAESTQFIPEFETAVAATDSAIKMLFEKEQI